MVDRLAALGPIPTAPDVEEGPPAHVPGEGFMADFFQEVGRIKQKMSVVRRNIKLIEGKHKSAFTAITVESNKQSAEEMDELMDETTEKAQEIRNDLKKMDAANKALQQGTAEARIRNNMQMSLSRKFMDMMTEYQDVQAQFKSKMKDRVARQYKIVNPQASEKEIEEVLENGSGNSIFADKILTPAHAAAKNALADIQEKHQDILKLERSLEELHQLFVDMSVLVEAQGEMLNQIEHSVEETVVYVEQGVVELNKAQEYHKAGRKKMLILCCCLTVIFAVVLGVVLGVLKTQGVM